MNYHEFLERKKRLVIESGFDVPEERLNPILFDFRNGYGIELKKSYWQIGTKNCKAALNSKAQLSFV